MADAFYQQPKNGTVVPWISRRFSIMPKTQNRKISQNSPEIYKEFLFQFYEITREKIFPVSFRWNFELSGTGTAFPC